MIFELSNEFAVADVEDRGGERMLTFWVTNLRTGSENSICHIPHTQYIICIYA